MYQILSAVFYCHKNKIVHRDLKPENILFDTDKPGAQLKIIDFGTSLEYDGSQNTKLTQRMGTPYYIAPEVLQKKYDEQCDIWSCGVILYILLCGYPPFSAKKEEAIMEKIQLGQYSIEGSQWKEISNQAQKLISHMLQYSPTNRYSAEQCLNDSWFQQHRYIANETDTMILQSSLDNMKKFRVKNQLQNNELVYTYVVIKVTQQLQEASYMFIIHFLTTKEEKLELTQVFQSLDKNGDGMLSQLELIEGKTFTIFDIQSQKIFLFKSGYRQHMGLAQAEQEANRIIKNVDKNQSGLIDYSQFIMASLNRHTILTQDKIETAFKMMDTDGSGFLSYSQIKEMFSGIEESSEKSLKDIFSQVDLNGDNQISLPEFKQMLLNLLN